MTVLRIDVTGWPEVDRRLDGAAQRVVDARPVWDDVADAVTAQQARFFDSQGEGSWPPLSRRYAAWKARRRPGRPPGVLTEALRRSLTSGGSAEYSVRRWDADELEVGTKDPVAVLMRKHRRPPVRPPTSGEEAEYVGLIRRWVVYGEQS